MSSASRYNVDRRMLAEESPAASVCSPYKPEARVDIALLVSALFLQRFGLAVGQTSVLTLNIIPVALIIIHQFASGRLLIQYDRLLWFLAVALTATCSLLLNFSSTMLSSYGLFLLMYSLFVLNRPSTPDQYRSTLQGFQVLVLILSYLAIAQFAAQFLIDGRQIIQFFGIFPDFLFAAYNMGLANTIGAISQGSSLIKSNGIFLAEPSTMSQMAALGILIEVLEFRRPRYLLVLSLGLLLAYSGTGISILLISLPLACVFDRRAHLPALLVSLVAFGLLATGIIDLSVFTSRVGEFENTRASGFGRFVSSFWMAAEYCDIASLSEFLRGNGPGAAFSVRVLYNATSATWFNLPYQYGLIGAFIFICFWRSCFRQSRCPKPVIVGLIYHYLFTDNNLLNTPLLTIMVVLCTLNGPGPPLGRIDQSTQRRSPFLAGSAAG
jgi:hypothetical protein